MCRYCRLIALWSIFSGFTFTIFSQSCDLILRGIILDESTGIPLGYAGIYLQESKQGTTADSLGNFMIPKVCPGKYHIQVSHLGCETENLFLVLARDTSLVFMLHHHSELLNEIEVHGNKETNSTQIANSISKEEIAREANKNFTELLEKIVGVNSIKSGSGIAKPVIHGLYGNRITVINNGLVQAGQQWGNDHAPEIDPFMADHLSVIKGASALAYGGNGLGGIVLAEQNPIADDPHLHGQLNYIYQTNGHGHTLNAQLHQHQNWASWKLSGTFKLTGDQSAPSYFLTNTGRNENNIGLQVEKKWKAHFQSRLFYSLFDTEIGILRGSHIGNLSDLEEAVGRTVPFYTKTDFSYQIEAPKQTVQHHLVKLENKWLMNDHMILSINYGTQLNQRKEFDVRRSGRSELPALSLKQYAHFLEGISTNSISENTLLKTGIQINMVDNTNDPATGILPLIPDYRAWTTSAFGIWQKEYNKTQWELGFRYDFKDIYAVTISQTLPRSIIRYQPQFNNISTSIGNKYRFNQNLLWTTNLGLVWRSPEVNELFSFGLHQGVSGLEEGNPNLMQEKSIKLLMSLDASSGQKFFGQVLGYFQYIDNYIYLQPRDEFRLTIRGAFPVFNYVQTNASILGADMLCSFEWNKNLKTTLAASLVTGQDRNLDQPLIYMPAPLLKLDLNYSFPAKGQWANTFLNFHGKQVFRQNRYDINQDYLEPPSAYFLTAIEAGTSRMIHNTKLKFSITVENLFNTEYRDYLNRLRYFAAETGRSVNLRINYSF